LPVLSLATVNTNVTVSLFVPSEFKGPFGIVMLKVLPFVKVTPVIYFVTEVNGTLDCAPTTSSLSAFDTQPLTAPLYNTAVVEALAAPVTEIPLSVLLNVTLEPLRLAEPIMVPPSNAGVAVVIGI
jgi:hypothetical protein